MHQVIKGKAVYVVDFDTMPELPITGLTAGEQAYVDIRKKLFPLGAPLLLGDAGWRRPTYAQALTRAIEDGVITEPGKYGIHLVPGTEDYEIYTIIEKDQKKEEA